MSVSLSVGSPEIERSLRLRDALRAAPFLRARYQALKHKRCADPHPGIWVDYDGDLLRSAVSARVTLSRARSSTAVCSETSCGTSG